MSCAGRRHSRRWRALASNATPTPASRCSRWRACAGRRDRVTRSGALSRARSGFRPDSMPISGSVRTESSSLPATPTSTSETVVAYEAGYRQTPFRTLVWSLELFHNRYDDLRTQEPTGTAPPVRLGNGLNVNVSGFKIAGSLQPQAVGARHQLIHLSERTLVSSMPTAAISGAACSKRSIRRTNSS